MTQRCIIGNKQSVQLCSKGGLHQQLRSLARPELERNGVGPSALGWERRLIFQRRTIETRQSGSGSITTETEVSVPVQEVCNICPFWLTFDILR